MKKQVLISAAIISAMVLGTACGATANADTHSTAPGSEVTTDTEDAAVKEDTEEAAKEAEETEDIDISVEGSSLVIDVDSNSSTGASWSASDMQNVMEDGEAVYTAGENKEGLIGVGGTERFKFIATEEGIGSLILTYAQPWNGGSIFKIYMVNFTVDADLNISDVTVTPISVDAGVEYSFEGDTITIKIPENATTGYTWMIENAENMEQVSDDFEPATNESEDPDAQLAGAGGTRILVFKVTGAEPVVHLNHGRSWDASTYKAYTLNVEADENMNIYSASFCQVVNNAE